MGKRAAVCFSIDDVHPSTGADAYEAGGDLSRGALGHVQWLLERHPQLRVTLFTTPDWRQISHRPTRALLRHLPWIRDHFYLSPVLPAGTMRLSRHPAFVSYLRSLERTEIGLHGLHHISKGVRIPVEFQNQTVAKCSAMLTRSMEMFLEADLPFLPGMAPPGWNAPPSLLKAMAGVGLRFIASARDIATPVRRGAKTNMSGLRGVSLLEPEMICGGRLVHITSNFQATSPIERAFDIIESGGLLGVKAHIIKNGLGHIALDGMDEQYRNYLDTVFTQLDKRYGDSLWWTSMGEVSARLAGGRR